MTKIAASQRQEVADLCFAGKSKAEVAAVYGVSMACIVAILRNLGVKVPPAQRGPKLGAKDERYAAMGRMYESGKTMGEVAVAFAVTNGNVSRVLRDIGVPARTGLGKIGKYKRMVSASEHPAIAEKYKTGQSLEEIGTEYGVTRERVRQILSANGVGRMDGGSTMKQLAKTSDKVAKIRARNERREAYWREKWGMSLADYGTFVAEHGSTDVKTSPMSKYNQQRQNAKRRGIAWNFTFPEWWNVWQESGKWEERALTKHGYVMARYGDGDTPYSAENVYICTQSQNAKDSYIVSPAAERFKNSRAMPGSGLGYSHNKRSKTNPYVAQFRGKNIGAFPAPELARAAYLAAAEAYKRSLA